MDDNLYMEKQTNNFAKCCDLAMTPDFGCSEVTLPTPMEDLIFSLVKNVRNLFVPEVVDYFLTENGLELIRLVFWYSFLYMLGENEMQDKRSRPRDALGKFICFIS
jgi:hypothetical protein